MLMLDGVTGLGKADSGVLNTSGDDAEAKEPLEYMTGPISIFGRGLPPVGDPARLDTVLLYGLGPEMGVSP